MWDLEYVMLFGIPSNKVELSEGRSRWAFPFTSRAQAEAHFTIWLETLARWKNHGRRPAVHKKGDRWKTTLKGIAMELFPRPVEFRIPIDWEAFDALETNHQCPVLCIDGGQSRGLLAALNHQDVQMNLSDLFGGICQRHGGAHGGRVDIALSDTAAVAPDQFYFRKSREECMINGDYFCGIPDLIAEVLSPTSESMDRGPRMELYRKSRIRHFWIVDPNREFIEVYELLDRAYILHGTYGADAMFSPALFPGEKVQVAKLFKTQAKRSGRWATDDEPDPLPNCTIAPEKTLGLEYFFLLGHPDRRWEIWGNKVPSALVFGSAMEAKARFSVFVQEACRWEGMPDVAPTVLDTHAEQAEVGRFKLTRSARQVHLDVAVDARKYRELLTIWNRKEVWDWGEE